MKYLVIERDIRYRLAIPLDPGEEHRIPPTVELADMEIVNDSGPVVYIDEIKEQQAA